MRKDAFLYILTLRLFPAAPFWLANLALGLIDIRLSTYVLATFIGVAPMSVVYAGLGSGLGVLFAAGARPDLSLALHPCALDRSVAAVVGSDRGPAPARGPPARDLARPYTPGRHDAALPNLAW